MIYKKIQLDPEDENIYLEVFAANKTGAYVRDAVLVIPGGGYQNVVASREGEPIALEFMHHGFNAFVLHYSVLNISYKPYPAQLIQASLAMKHIRDHAEEYNIDPARVFVIGFSAGGHLTACLGTMWHKKVIYDAIDMPYGYNKPTGIIPVYAVISADDEIGYSPGLRRLMGVEELTEEQKLEVSVDKNVNKDSSPAFIVHTSNDPVVNVKNALALANAYADQGMRFELHIYYDGPHGMSLGTEVVNLVEGKKVDHCFAKWVESAAMWTKGIS